MDMFLNIMAITAIVGFVAGLVMDLRGKSCDDTPNVIVCPIVLVVIFAIPAIAISWLFR